MLSGLAQLRILVIAFLHKNKKQHLDLIKVL